MNKVTGDSHPVNEKQWETELEDFMNHKQEMDWTVVGA